MIHAVTFCHSAKPIIHEPASLFKNQWILAEQSIPGIMYA